MCGVHVQWNVHCNAATSSVGPPLCSPVTIGLGATCPAALVASQYISGPRRLAAAGAGGDRRPSHGALEKQPLRTAENHKNLRSVPMPCVSFFTTYGCTSVDLRAMLDGSGLLLMLSLCTCLWDQMKYSSEGTHRCQVQ